MLKRLRIQFIILTMAMIVLVLSASFAAICYLNWQQNVQDMYTTLNATIDHALQGEGPSKGRGKDRIPLGDDALAQNAVPSEPSVEPGSGGDADPAIGETPSGAATDSSADSESDASHDQAEGSIAPKIGGGDMTDKFVPIALYAIAYNGESSLVSELTTASIDEDVAEKAMHSLSTLESGNHYLSDLGLYAAKRVAGGVTLIAFADAGSVDSWSSLVPTLLVIGIATLLVFFVIVIFFSRWALRPVERAWSQQRQFVADASHELKTPLTVILANSSILLEHPEKSVQSQAPWIDSTQTEARRMRELVDEMLTLARLDAEDGKTLGHSSFETLDFAECAEGELLQFESVAYECGVSLDSDIKGPAYVRGNATALAQLVDILLDNACKYAGENGRVWATLSAEKRHAVFCVHNTGSVIAAEDLEHIFDRFWRADKARTSGAGGFGLGLSIAQRIAHDHNGLISATSTEADGTAFTVSIPLAKAPEKHQSA